eukprot:jgi/Mesvir1/23596/Mv25735-RA.3
MAGVDFVLCGLITVGFVAALYLWNILRPGDKLRHRNHPTVIKRRFISSALSVLFGILVVKFRGLRLDCTSSSSADPLAEPIPLARLLGFRAEKWVPAIVVPLMLTAIIFLGPLLMALLDMLTLPLPKEKQPYSPRQRGLLPQLLASIHDLKQWRNLVIVSRRVQRCQVMVRSSWFPWVILLLGVELPKLAHAPS